jgi:hypothetical protein
MKPGRVRHGAAPGPLFVAATLAASALAGPASAQPGAPPTAAAPCTVPGPQEAVRRVAAEGLELAWRARTQPIPLHRMIELDIVLCGPAVQQLQVDADMPAHRHGMNYRATVEALGDGRYRARGLLFHMAGRWRLLFDVDRDGRRLRLADEIVLR